MKRNVIIMLLLIITSVGIMGYEIPKFTGWEIKSKIETYYPDNLWEIINGAADAFVSYGFNQLTTFEIARGNLVFVVYIYDMGNALNAYGMYRSENSPSSKSVNIGIETQFSDYLTVMLKGKYYLKLETVKGKTNQENSSSLVKQIAQSIAGDSQSPPELRYLPEVDKVEGSERFTKENFLGVKELSNCVHAQYKTKDSEYKIFIMMGDKEESQQDILAKLSSKWTQSKVEKYTVYQREIPYTGTVGIFIRKNRIMGISGIKNNKLLEEKIIQLQKK